MAFDETRVAATNGAARSGADDSEQIGPVERFMYSAVPVWTVVLLVILGGVVSAFLLVAGRNAADGDHRYGVIGSFAAEIAKAPSNLHALMRGDFDNLRLGEPAVPLNDGFSNLQPGFQDPGYMLISRPDEQLRRSVVRLVRLADRKTLKEFRPDIGAINARSHLQSPLLNVQRDRGPERYRITHPLLMDDGGIIFADESPLVRVDACDRVMWTIDGIFSHSIERDAAGSLWVVETAPKSGAPNVSPLFRDDGFMQISPDGRILKRFSIRTILEQNGLDYLWKGRNYSDDAFHANEVQPVSHPGKYWKSGDLFLSLRSLSMVALFRPSTGKIIWWQDHPWRMQHDVEVINDHQISVFDNHVATGYVPPLHQVGAVDGHSRVLVYDFANGAVTSPLDAAMAKADIRSYREGRATPLPNGDFMIEETVFGRLLRFGANGQLRWQYVAADSKK